jgi:hypothetical protein
VPGGQEGPPRRFDVDVGCHSPKLAGPQPGGRPTLRHPGGPPPRYTGGYGDPAPQQPSKVPLVLSIIGLALGIILVVTHNNTVHTSSV